MSTAGAGQGQLAFGISEVLQPCAGQLTVWDMGQQVLHAVGADGNQLLEVAAPLTPRIFGVSFLVLLADELPVLGWHSVSHLFLGGCVAVAFLVIGPAQRHRAGPAAPLWCPSEPPAGPAAGQPGVSTAASGQHRLQGQQQDQQQDRRTAPG